MDNPSNTIYKGESFYLMTRRNGEKWKVNLNRPFVLHLSGSTLFGQFITSMWFKSLVASDDCFDVLVIKTKRPWASKKAQEDFYKELTRCLDNCDGNYEEVIWVEMWKRYRSSDLENIFADLDAKMIQENGTLSGENGGLKNIHVSSTHTSRNGPHSIQMCFDGVPEKFEEGVLTTNYFMSCPSFALNFH